MILYFKQKQHQQQQQQQQQQQKKKKKRVKSAALHSLISLKTLRLIKKKPATLFRKQFCVLFVYLVITLVISFYNNKKGANLVDIKQTADFLIFIVYRCSLFRICLCEVKKIIVSFQKFRSRSTSRLGLILKNERQRS